MLSALRTRLQLDSLPSRPHAMLSHQTPTGATTFGYLSAVESVEHGYFGGYLLISPLGRPVEFHCTAPVRPSRAQEILYGPTLHPYLLGEQIAGTLLGKAQAKPQIVLTDQPSVLYQRSKIDVPLVLLKRSPTGDSSADPDKILLSGHLIELASGYSADLHSAIALLNKLAERVDLPEPFDRIHEAIREAQRIGERGPEANGQAA
jgi:hypothetical protein